MAKRYVDAASLADKHRVSMSTIRRRIVEGKLFPGARKKDAGLGKIWQIPHHEAEAVSLKDISPKIYQKRYKIHIDTNTDDEDFADKSIIKSLEDRVTTLEQLLMKYLAGQLHKDD